MNIFKLWDRAGMILVFVLLFIISSIFVEDFFSSLNMVGLALSVSMAGLVACSMLLCLAMGDLDLSVGSVVAASGVVAAVILRDTDSVFLAYLFGIGFGVALGAVHGVLVAYLKLNALIVTLAGMQVARGLAYIFAGGKAIGIVNSDFYFVGMSKFLGVPTPVIITVLFFIIFYIILNKTIFGRDILAIGGNIEAARLAGVPVNKTKLIAFIISGATSALAGVILASRMTSGQPMTSIGFELIVISACVLGGVSLTGGVGKVSYIIAGVLILGIVENTMNLMNINPFYQYVVRGAILAIAIIVDKYKTKKFR